MYFQNELVLFLRRGDPQGCMKEKDGHRTQKLVARGRAVEGQTSSACAVSKGSKVSDGSHTN